MSSWSMLDLLFLEAVACCRSCFAASQVEPVPDFNFFFFFNPKYTLTICEPVSYCYLALDFVCLLIVVAPAFLVARSKIQLGVGFYMNLVLDPLLQPPLLRRYCRQVENPKNSIFIDYFPSSFHHKQFFSKMKKIFFRDLEYRFFLRKIWK